MKSSVKIRVSPYLVFLFCFLAYFGRIGFFVSLFLAAAAHELGHLSYYFLAGKTVHEIRFDLCGAVIRAVPLDPAGERACAVLGPVVNFSLFALFFQVYPTFAYANLGLGLYNLLPIYPLDGGRLLSAILPMGSLRYVSGCVSLVLMLAVVSICVWKQTGLWYCAPVAAVLWRLHDMGKKEAV